MRPNFEKGGGLITAVAQDYKTGRVLMVAYMNEVAWEKTLQTGKVHYWSRSRGKLWCKGETSGHFQLVKGILIDCDEDAVVIKVEQLSGAACHTGYDSCFYRAVTERGTEIVGKKVFNPEDVYGRG